MTPDFLIIGAMKAATTSLHEYIRSHPGAYMPPQKEIDFFSVDENWVKGWRWYSSLFSAARPGAVIGEASPSYSKRLEHPAAAERIASSIPDVKLIYCVRDPVERLVSHYRHEVARGRETRPLETAVLDDPRYTDASRYGSQLAQHLLFVPGDRVFVLESEALRADREQVMDQVFEFLGLDTSWRGYVGAPELYGTDDRLAVPRGVRMLTESERFRGARGRLSPAAKRRLRAAASVLGRRRQTPNPPPITPALRDALADALAQDREHFAEVREQCLP